MREIGTYKNLHFNDILNETNLSADTNKVASSITTSEVKNGATFDKRRALASALAAQEAEKKAKGNGSFFLEERDFDNDDLEDDYDDIDPIDDGDGDPNTDLDISMFGDDLDDDEPIDNDVITPGFVKDDDPDDDDVLIEKNEKSKFFFN